MPQSVAELNRVAAARTALKTRTASDAGFIGKIIDMFKKISTRGWRTP